MKNVKFNALSDLFLVNHKNKLELNLLQIPNLKCGYIFVVYMFHVEH